MGSPKPSAPARADTAPRHRSRRVGIILATLLFVLPLGVFALAALEVRAYQGAVLRDDFTIPGQYPVPVTRFTPTTAPLKVVAVVAHGYGASKGAMSALGVELARAGITAYTFDFPGHGASAVPFAAGGNTDYDGAVAAASTELDTTVDEVVRYALSHSSSADTRVILIGHSMGTGVVGDYALRHMGQVPLAAVVLISPVWSGTPDPATFPGLLAIAGSNDLAVSVRHVGRLMLALCGQALPASSDASGSCGANGAAREFRILPDLNHVSIVTATQSIAVIVGFLRRAVVPAMPATTVQADDQLHWLIVGALAAVLATIPLVVLLAASLRLPRATTADAGRDTAIPFTRVLVGEGALIAATVAAALVQQFVVPSPLSFLGELTAPDVTVVLAVAGILWLAALLVILPAPARQAALPAGQTWWREIILAILVFAFLYLTLGQLVTAAYADFALTAAKIWRFGLIAVLLLPFFFASEWLHGAVATSAPRLAVALGALPKVVMLVALAGIVGSLFAFVVVIFLYFLALEAWARRVIPAPFVIVPLFGALVLAWAIASVYPFVT